MNSIMKKVIFVFVFVLLTLVLPSFLLLVFVDAALNVTVYVVVYALIIFAILGYVVASVRATEKKLEATMEEIKLQNAAIAYKISNSGTDFIETPVKQAAVPAQAPVQNANVPLNPSEPLVMPAEKKQEKKPDDGFDDFK